MKSTAPTAAFVALATLTVARAQGFIGPGACSGFTMGTSGSPGTIQATGCNDSENLTIEMDLNNCIANNNGQLAGQANGGFGGSCDNFVTSGTVFYASCNQPDGSGYAPAGSVDLNSIISYNTNDNTPELVCYSIIGLTTYAQS